MCVKHLTEKVSLKVIGIIYQSVVGYDGPPTSPRMVHGVPLDIQHLCEHIQETPRTTTASYMSTEEEATMKAAYHRNCRILDSGDYSAWIVEARLRNDKVRRWLEESQDLVHMHYHFDLERVPWSFELRRFSRQTKLMIQQPNEVYQDGWTPLCKAAQAGDRELVKELLQHGADANVPNIDGTYPLYFAALECNYRMVKNLIYYGADINLIPAVDFKGLIRNIHWRLGKPKQRTKREQLFEALGLDPRMPAPATEASSRGPALPASPRHRSTARRKAPKVRPSRPTRRRRPQGGLSSGVEVVRVHSSPPRSKARRWSLPQRGFTFTVGRYGKLNKKLKRKVPTVDVDAIDLTGESGRSRPSRPRLRTTSATIAAPEPTRDGGATPVATFDPYLSNA